MLDHVERRQGAHARLHVRAAILCPRRRSRSRPDEANHDITSRSTSSRRSSSSTATQAHVRHHRAAHALDQRAGEEVEIPMMATGTSARSTSSTATTRRGSRALKRESVDGHDPNAGRGPMIRFKAHVILRYNARRGGRAIVDRGRAIASLVSASGVSACRRPHRFGRLEKAKRRSSPATGRTRRRSFARCSIRRAA